MFIGEDPDYPPPVLHAASYWGEEQAVKELLSAGASPWLEDKAGRTALDWCEDDDNPCCEVLVEAENKPLRLLQLSRNRVVDVLYDEWERTGRGNSRQYDKKIADLKIPADLEPILRFEVEKFLSF